MRDEDPQCLGDGNMGRGELNISWKPSDVNLTQIPEHEVYHNLGADGNGDRASWFCLINAL